ncbi:alkylation response protein AidB-like acyl-CoA dehydrogenase [Parvibaculum indicum]|uniref:acyl-CoA dehydrogenase family protein n=1 Tax=Parvibaculum indicum TaxID=562969 RepID=UPI00142200CE|nr:acyl-CoA dehydrogenase family protein [Parvibaculum indicum]NIJ41987.1 alkylation response protein AidB-like acyl-CoA dehydrogenase [Parvibaculum indicum]
MDFNDTPEEAKFRAEVRDWLSKNATLKSEAKNANVDRTQDQVVKRNKEWQAKKADAGYAALTWPKEWGGAGASPIHSVIYGQEESRYDVPGSIFAIGLGMCIPTVMAWGSDEHKKRFVKPAIRGEEIWCQLFSEPAGGSDVAGLRTRAEKDGDEWVINGQKVWTSGAQFCDYGILLTRTDPNVPKHKGLTMFWIDMKDPAVEVRPIRQMSGESGFNEVFFTDLRVKDSQRLGKEGDGWKVALTTLMNERLAVGGSQGNADVDDLIRLARDVDIADGPAINNGAVRERIADWYVQAQGLKFTRFRTLTALSKGETPGPESSISKIVAAKKMQDLGSFGMDLQDQGGIIRDRNVSPLEGAYTEQWFGAAGYRIAGGTDEILRNIVAERVLGLPQDVRVDKDKAFNELPKGK